MVNVVSRITGLLMGFLRRAIGARAEGKSRQGVNETPGAL